MNNQNAPYGQINTAYDTEPAKNSTPMTPSTKKEIVTVSGILGLCILLFHYLGVWIGKLVVRLVEAGTIDYTFTMEQILQILYTVTTILVPFAIGAWFIRKVQKRREGTLLPLDKPTSGILFVEALGIGCLAIVTANMLTALGIQVFESHGIVFDSYKPDSPHGAYQFAWMFLSNAVVPAMVEEFALRGVLLQSLRKYGDAFAVVASSLVFAMMHGNMTQAPFAFLLGAAMAIVVLMTKSLWTSMAIHLVNNTYSVAMTALYNAGNDRLTLMVTVSLYTLAAIYGVIALVYLFGMHNGRELWKSRYQPGGPSPEGIRVYRWQAWLYTLVSPTMILAMVVLVVELSKTVHWAG